MTGAGLAAVLLFGAVGSPALRRSPPRPRRQPPAVAAKAPSASVDKDFNACRTPADRKRLVKLTLKPDTTIDNLVVWRIVETHKVRSTPVPLYGFDGRRLPG